MKKLVTLVLALALVLSIGTTALADTVTDVDETRTIDVTAKYTSSTTTGTVYYVQIDWDPMTFTYTEKKTETWEPTNHSYSTSATGSWDRTSSEVTVTNHSNVDVDVAMSYAAKATDIGVTATLTGGNKTLSAGEVGGYKTADSVTGTLTITGTPNSKVTATGITMGTITITIK